MLKKYLVGTSLAFSSLLWVFFWGVQASASTGVVGVTGTGKDLSDAMVNLLRGSVAKNFKDEAPDLVKSVLQAEIVPNASSFVQSYKVVDSGRSGQVSISANLDLEVIRSLLALQAKKLDSSEAVKALVAVKGAKLPTNLPSTKGPQLDPFSALETGAKDRLARRGFDVVHMSSNEVSLLGLGDDPSSPELLRGLASKAGARIAVGIHAKFDSIENENSHNRESRLFVQAILVDGRSGSILGKADMNVPEPKGRRDLYLSDLQRYLVDESKDLFQELLVMAGRKLVRPGTGMGHTIVRVSSPLSAVLVNKFRLSLEGLKGVRSVTEHGASRGYLDLAVKPALAADQMVKLMRSIQSEEFQIVFGPDAENGTLSVTLTAKTQVISTEGGSNEPY